MGQLIRYRFQNDYSEGAHPEILQALQATNEEQSAGYGMDSYCAAAAALLRQAAGKETAAVHFLTGGTQTNLAVIGSALRPYQAVISADTGHINTHEAGAIEAVGHKVLAVPSLDGKLTPEAIKAMLQQHQDEHMVQPKMVYLSQPTELGTLYTLAELEAIRNVCLESGLYLYLDGARIASALTAEGNDVFLPDFARLTDGFYIGGTKCGAFLGEALLLTHPDLQQDFRYTMKQRGGLFAKGRVIGIQFEVLFRDGLYERLGRHANHCADRLRACFEKEGIPFLVSTKTNQVFPVLSDALADALAKEYLFERWGKREENETIIRLVTSWATKPSAVEEFAEAVARLKQAGI